MRVQSLILRRAPRATTTRGNTNKDLKAQLDLETFAVISARFLCSLALAFTIGWLLQDPGYETASALTLSITMLVASLAQRMASLYAFSFAIGRIFIYSTTATFLAYLLAEGHRQGFIEVVQIRAAIGFTVGIAIGAVISIFPPSLSNEECDGLFWVFSKLILMIFAAVVLAVKLGTDYIILDSTTAILHAILFFAVSALELALLSALFIFFHSETEQLFPKSK